MNLSFLKIKTVQLTKSIIGEAKTTRLMNKRYIENYKKQDIIFIHIPKAAGSSVTQILYGKRNGHLTAEYVKSCLGDSYLDKFSFSVTRHPYSRLLSAYNFARQGQTQHGAISNPQFYQLPVFNTFESFIENWLIKQDLRSLDRIFWPQYFFVFKDNVSLVDALFKVENLDQLEEKLTELLGKKVHFEKINRSTYKQDISYSRELKNLIYNIYQKDFDLLGYQK